jgi:hypothetical protein
MQLLAVGFTVITVGKAIRANVDRIETIKLYDVLNGCSDPYTALPTDDLTKAIEESITMQRWLLPLGIILFFIILGNIIFLQICCMMFIKIEPKEDESRFDYDSDYGMDPPDDVRV